MLPAGEEAIRIVKDHRPDIVVSDIGMPKEDGYSLIRSVRARESLDTAHVPAIALTAHARPEDVAQALASGFQMHVAKPVDPSRLLSAVTATLDTQSASLS